MPCQRNYQTQVSGNQLLLCIRIPCFNPLCQFHFFFCRQQRRSANLPQIHPHRVRQTVVVSIRIGGSAVILCRFCCRFIHHFNFHGLERIQHSIHLLRIHAKAFQLIGNFLTGQFALFTSQFIKIVQFLLANVR